MSGHQPHPPQRPHGHHHDAAPVALNCGIITASDTRRAADDESGRLIRELLAAAGHHVSCYEIMPDEPDEIRAAVVGRLQDLDVIIINGGTGISSRDSTYEAIHALLDKELEGFGELFRMLSYHQIGAAAFLSRALAGIARGKIVVSLPGSPAACRLALEKLLIPQLPHMAELLALK